MNIEIAAITHYLSNIYENYLIDTKQYVHPARKMQCLGAMEALLVVLGIQSAGQPLQYKTHDRTFMLFWFFPFKYKETETYEQYILRLVYETLNGD